MSNAPALDVRYYTINSDPIVPLEQLHRLVGTTDPDAWNAPYDALVAFRMHPWRFYLCRQPFATITSENLRIIEALCQEIRALAQERPRRQ